MQRPNRVLASLFLCGLAGQLITQGAPYRQAWVQYRQDGDLHALIAAVAGKYATDPQYAFLAATIAGQLNVAQAIALARQEATNATT
jgi:flagellum-specific peptidoglycan hydrolase FlgJ